MSREIELKLGVAPSDAATVIGLPWLRELSSGCAERRHLQTVYFDTRRLKLHGCGVVLRVRHAERRRLQEIKSMASRADGAFARGEWKHEIPGNRPDLRLAKDTPLSRLGRKKKLRRQLRPVFETVVERTTFPIHAHGADLELAVDRGHIAARGVRQREPISEIEIELKAGDPGELAKLAQRLSRSVAVSYAPRSKAERGYALRCRNRDAAVHGRKISVDRHATAGEAFRTIGLACLNHTLANERAIRQADPEGVHQMRVGLRRLRAAISLFKDVLRGAETEAIKRELKWLTGQLGTARELDVLISERVRPLRDATPLATEAGVLEQDLKTQRHEGMEKARAAIDSARYRAIGLHAALWLAHGRWMRGSAAGRKQCREMPVDKFARAVLARHSKKRLKKARKVERLDPHARHKLRIAVKKLRYACDFFASTFPGARREARRKRLCKVLKRLQGSLGTLNDIEAHRQLAERIARSGRRSAKQPSKALAMGFITGREDEQAAFCLANVGKAATQLAKLPAYWK